MAARGAGGDRRDAFACSTGWRADAALLRALAGHAAAGGNDAAGRNGGGRNDAATRRAVLAAADWSGGTTGRIVEPPPGPVLRPAALEEIVGFVQVLGRGGEAGLPIEIELAGAAGSGRTALAAQAAARLGCRLVAVDAAALASRADGLAAATREARRARLDGSVLAWERAEALPAELWKAIPAAPLTFLSVETPVAGTAGAAGHRSIRRSITCGPIRPARTPGAMVVARRHAGSHGGRRVGAAARRDLRRRACRARRRPRGR